MAGSTDPFEGLRLPATQADPAPAFAADLRARIVRALGLPRGVIVSTDLDTENLADPAADTAPEAAASGPVPAAVPYLTVDGAQAAIDWYVEIFGAEISGAPYIRDDGRIGHADLALPSGHIYLSDPAPELGVYAPRAGESSVSLMLAVDDADDSRRRAVAAGANGDRPPYDGYGQRNAWIVDPFGHRWGLHSPLRASARPDLTYRHGDIGYISLWLPDADRARSFYSAVLGWTLDPTGHGPEGTTPRTGIQGGVTEPTLFSCYAVDDVDGAVEAILAAGGEADAPTDEPFGRSSMCTDPEGRQFAVYQLPGADGERIPTNGVRSGDLGYVTMEVVDSASARAFYGAVLGWTFSAGSVDDGWQVGDVRPMVGMSGGNPSGGAVPMWMVDDVAGAAERVRAAGGTATEPEQRPYGPMATCTDDQGSRFYLGLLGG